MLIPTHSSGDRVTVGPYECNIEQRFGDRNAYLCKTPSRPEPLVLKFTSGIFFPEFIQRAHALFQKSRASLMAVGLPDMVFCAPLDPQGYVIQELVQHVPGKDLTEYGNYSLEDIRDVLLAVSRQIGALMEHSLVHGDIKQENIVSSVRDDGSSEGTTLIDFGLMGEAGKLASTKDTCVMEANNPVGTPYYMSPEQIRGRYALTTDVFSTGLLGLALITDKTPYGMDFFDIYQDRDTLSHLLKDRLENTWRSADARLYLQSHLFKHPKVDRRLARSLIDFIFTCTRYSTHDRPQSGEEMEQILTDTGNITEI